jgi:hypothetical protein
VPPNLLKQIVWPYGPNRDELQHITILGSLYSFGIFPHLLIKPPTSFVNRICSKKQDLDPKEFEALVCGFPDLSR